MADSTNSIEPISEASNTSQKMALANAEANATTPTTAPHHKDKGSVPNGFWIAVFALMTLTNTLQGDQINSAMQLVYMTNQKKALEHAKDNIQVPLYPALGNNAAANNSMLQNYENGVKIYNSKLGSINQEISVINVVMQGIQSRGNASIKNIGAEDDDISFEIRTIANAAFTICNICMAMTNLSQFNMSTNAGVSAA